MSDESILAEMRRTRGGKLDSRTAPYKFRTRLLDEVDRNFPIPENQKKLTHFFKK